MSEATTTPAATETGPATDQGTAPADQSDQNTAAPPPAPPADQTPDDDGAKPDIDWKAKAREWEKRSKENKAAADRLAKLEEANQTEAERLANRATQAEQERDALLERIKSTNARSAVTQAATVAKAVDAETVYLHLKANGDLDEFDDDGQPVGVDKAITALSKRKPHLFANPAAGTKDTTATSAPLALNDGDGLTNALMSKLNIA